LNSLVKDNGHNIKSVTILLASLTVVVVLAFYVFSLPPQVGKEKQPGEGGFTELAPNYLGISKPQLAQLKNDVYFVWNEVDKENTEDIKFIRSSNNGIAFSAPENLSDNSGNSTDPQIVSYGNSTYVVWEDDTNGNDEIYFKISPAGKSGFGRIYNLSRNDGNSTDPQIVSYGNSTYVVWEDNTNGVNDTSFVTLTSKGPA
jgi:hypothetical protein